ncbi:MAG: Ig-like domain-containing protein [Treponema sp.]|nr:Ig-like domain-containing protein [Treponema sp.]
MKKRTACIPFLLFIALTFFSCKEIFGKYDNPSDPSSDDYQGYESIAATGIRLDKTTADCYVRNTVQLTAAETPSEATDVPDWKSSDTSVAAVSQTGLVTGVKTGSCIVTAATGNYSASCSVTVKWLAVTGIALDKGILVLGKGNSRQLTASITPSEASDITVKWKSSNTSVASVDSSGKVTGEADGTADITATAYDNGANTCTKTCSVTVTEGIVTYYANRSDSTGTVPEDNTVYNAGDTVTVLGNTGNLTASGYKFKGWNTADDGSGTTYSAGDTFTMPSSAVDLFAVWIISTHTVTFDANGGSGTMESQTGDDGSTITLPLNQFTRENYTFLGWAAESSAASADYSDGAVYTIGSDDVTLYAVWGAAVSISISSGSSITFTDVQSVTKGQSLTISVQETYSSYQWYFDGDKLDGSTGQSYTLDTSTVSAGVHTLTVFAADSGGNLSSGTVSVSVIN